MAAGKGDLRATFAVDLAVDSSTVAPATKSLHELQEQLVADKAALSGMQGALRSLKGSGAVTAATLTSLKNQIAAQKASIGQNTAQLLKASVAYTTIGKPIKALEPKIKETSKSLLSAGAIAGIAASATTKLIDTVVGLAKAVPEATLGFLQFGLAAADARRSELLSLEAMTKMRTGMMLFGFGAGLAAGKAEDLQSAIDSVSSHVAISREAVGGYERQLYMAGLRGANLQSALEAVSITAATQGEAAASATAGWAGYLAYTGQSVKGLADTVKSRLGGIAQKQMLSLNVQILKMRENMNALFKGVHVEGFLKGLQQILSVFDQGTVTGKVLRQVIENVFGPLGDNAEKAGFTVKRALQGMIIGALYVELGFYKLRNTLYRTFGPEVFRSWDLASDALRLGTYGAIAFAGALTIAAAQAALLGYAILKLPAAILYTWDSIKKSFSDLENLGGHIITGLLNGIVDGTGAVVNAMGDLAKKMYAKFADFFKMHSPSVKMRIGGRFLGQGLALGARDEQPRVQAAMTRMMAPPIDLGGIGNVGARMGAAVAAGIGASGGGAQAQGHTLQFGDIIVQGGGKEAAIDFRRQLVYELEGVGIRLGGPST